MNKLYQAIESNPRTKGHVKLIGIGAGNSNYEISYFRKTYAIPFPLFADRDFAVHKKIGEVRTPYFFGVRNHPDGSHTLIYSRLGGIKQPAAFLEKLADQAGL